jgi:hypothetical protein
MKSLNHYHSKDAISKAPPMIAPSQGKIHGIGGERLQFHCTAAWMVVKYANYLAAKAVSP